MVAAYADLGADAAANKTAADFFAAKIRAIVKDPATATRLIPTTYAVGTKRLCVDTGYYDTFNRPNVALADLHEAPIETITASGIRTAVGETAFDAIVFATGFDAMTGTLDRIDIRGRGGQTLRDKWAEGPRNYLGLMVEGFPNLFMITGPGSPSVLTNMIMAIEQHVEFVADAIGHVEGSRNATIEATREAEDTWVTYVNESAAETLYPQANSWYMGANVPGKPRLFMPYIAGFPAYVEACNDVVANGYRGFALA